MVYKYFEGDHKGSLEMQQKIESLVSALFAEVNPIPVKCALKLMGVIPDDYMRLPLTRSEKVDLIRTALNDFGIATEA